MLFTQPVAEIIAKRFSCRSYLEDPIEESKRQKLAECMRSLPSLPFGTNMRFSLLAATAHDRDALKGVGTYGLIKKPAGFLVGAVAAGKRNFEDFGYAMEYLILRATELDLGTCWIGGIFTKSGFARKISPAHGERIPAIATIGDIADPEKAKRAVARRQPGARGRLAWEELFFDAKFAVPLTQANAGSFAAPLEMVRIGPSASNKQPWRIVKEGGNFHFFMQRTKGYGNGLAFRLLGVADIQRIDMGIAMCHFALTANERGIHGKWEQREPAIRTPDRQTEYTASWMS